MKLYRAIYILFIISTVITSYNTSNHFNLKRKSEGSEAEGCQAKRFAFDTTDSVENLPIKISVFNRENKGMSYDHHTVEEYINVESLPKDTSLETVTHQSIETNNEEDKNNDQIISELVAEMIKDEKSFISSNFQLCSDAYSQLEDDEIRLLNSLTEAINKDLLVVPNPEQNVKQQQSNNVYSYSNSMFLNNFLDFPSPNFTADSIRVRFGSGFLNFLSTNQLIRVLVTLLNRNLKLTETERTELVGIIFGCIDFSLEMNFNNDQIVSIVRALLLSDVPHCFEQVFLTWKMWKVFTTEEQEEMLKDVIKNNSQANETKIKYKQETQVMLYLFVLNRDADNSNVCKVFHEFFIKIYGKTHILRFGEALTPSEYIERILFSADTLDTSLLDLPVVLKNFNDFSLKKLNESVRRHINIKNRPVYFTVFGKRYKIHICYVLAKFTREIVQTNNECVTGICDEIYFKFSYIKYVLNKWSKISIKSSSSASEREVNELRNVYGAICQIVQSKEYDSGVFLKLFNAISISDPLDRTFALFLFSLTKKSILKDVSKTPEWAEHIKNRSIKRHKFSYIENIFMYNADFSLKLVKSDRPRSYVKRITNILLNTSNMNKGLYRESYLYQQLLFHPKFKIFTNRLMMPYVQGLNNIGQLNNKEKRTQIARDLIFSKYYYESTIKLKFELMKAKGNLKDFRICLQNESKRYKNKTDVKSERDAFKNC